MRSQYRPNLNRSPRRRRLRAVSLFLQFFLFSASGEAARREKRGRQPEKKKTDCPHSQSQWNMRWPHNAKIRLADAWSVDNELSTIEAIDELMMAEALQECLSRFPKIDTLNYSRAYCTLRNETKWNLYFVKWKSVLCETVKCVLCEMKICILRNENLYFAKWKSVPYETVKSVLCEIAKWSFGSSYLRSWRFCNFADWFWKKPDFSIVLCGKARFEPKCVQLNSIVEARWTDRTWIHCLTRMYERYCRRKVQLHFCCAERCLSDEFQSKSLFVPVPSRAFSRACAISRVLFDVWRTKKKEKLLVVYVAVAPKTSVS